MAKAHKGHERLLTCLKKSFSLMPHINGSRHILHGHAHNILAETRAAAQAAGGT